MIELMGGIEPARTCILAALEAGKHVVSANKDLIAVHGKELLDMAEAHQVDSFLKRLLPEAFRLSVR